MMKTGDIILFNSNSKRAAAIERFQRLEDPESAKWTHSGLIYVAKYGKYVAEADVIPGKRIKSNVHFTPIDKALSSCEEIMWLSPINILDETAVESSIFKYIGTDYDYKNLIFQQPFLKIFDKWLGCPENSAERFICHEFVQTVINEAAGIFPNYYRGSVKEIYHSKHYIKNYGKYT